MAHSCLSTIDNPYNPMADYDHWFEFEIEHGYDSASYVDRIANITDEMSQEESDEEYDRAVDSIIANDLLGLYIKVVSPLQEIHPVDPTTIWSS